MTKELEVFSDRSDEALLKWMLGDAVIEEQQIYDENGRAITVPGCPLCRVEVHFGWLVKSLSLFLRCW